MYSNYLYDDRDAFRDLYVDVTDDTAPPAKPASVELTQPVQPDTNKSNGGLKSLLSRFGGGDNNLITLLILGFLLFDAEDDERLIILALAFLLGL